ncbi:MAG: pentapeptide repeat-containing protein [Elainella sp. C42_A2020_010]|nr:pentapeptide repeat-containing protein [Elainella sp. C42_A2020_010]
MRADLNGTSFSGANLGGANLKEAENWSTEQLSSALLCKTKLPEGANLDSDRDCKDWIFQKIELRN